MFQKHRHFNIRFDIISAPPGRHIILTLTGAGTEGFTVQRCRVTRVDGQGLLLEGYHRAARVLQNEFEWIGSHAMVSATNK